MNPDHIDNLGRKVLYLNKQAIGRSQASLKKLRKVSVWTPEQASTLDKNVHYQARLIRAYHLAQACVRGTPYAAVESFTRTMPPMAEMIDILYNFCRPDGDGKAAIMAWVRDAARHLVEGGGLCKHSRFWEGADRPIHEVYARIFIRWTLPAGIELDSLEVSEDVSVAMLEYIDETKEKEPAMIEEERI